MHSEGPPIKTVRVCTIEFAKKLIEASDVIKGKPNAYVHIDMMNEDGGIARFVVYADKEGLPFMYMDVPDIKY